MTEDAKMQPNINRNLRKLGGRMRKNGYTNDVLHQC